jgi:hypothetical protein
MKIWLWFSVPFIFGFGCVPDLLKPVEYNPDMCIVSELVWDEERRQWYGESGVAPCPEDPAASSPEAYRALPLPPEELPPRDPEPEP